MFLLDIHCRRKHSVYFVPLMTYSTSNICLTLKSGLSRSFKVIENGAVQQTICDFILVGHCNYSSILYIFAFFDVEQYRDLEIGVRGHSMSLKLVPFEISKAWVRFPIRLLQQPFVSIQRTAVAEIFSVKEWRDLENQVERRSRSSKMAPFDRPYATFYWSAIVNIALSCTIIELFDVE